MSRDWKPGDVAVIPFTAGEERAMWLGDRWAVTGGRGQSANYSIKRPLVVIDPVSITGPDETGDDGDPLVEIANCLRRLAEGDHAKTYRRRVAERLAEVFDPTPTKPEEPPKPEEPTGLGAVVEDKNGGLWVRVDMDEDMPWTSHSDDTLTYFNYREIAAVRVLSEGVQA